MKKIIVIFLIFLFLSLVVNPHTFAESHPPQADKGVGVNKLFSNKKGDTFNIEFSSSSKKEDIQSNQDSDKQGNYWARQIKENFGKDFDYIEYSPAQLRDIHSKLEWCNWIKNDFGKNLDYKKYSVKQLVDIYNRFQWLEWIKKEFGIDYSQSTYSAYELRILYNGFKRIKYTK